MSTTIDTQLAKAQAAADEAARKADDLRAQVAERDAALEADAAAHQDAIDAQLDLDAAAYLGPRCANVHSIFLPDDRITAVQHEAWQTFVNALRDGSDSYTAWLDYMAAIYEAWYPCAYYKRHLHNHRDRIRADATRYRDTLKPRLEDIRRRIVEWDNAQAEKTRRAKTLVIGRPKHDAVRDQLTTDLTALNQEIRDYGQAHGAVLVRALDTIDDVTIDELAPRAAASLDRMKLPDRYENRSYTGCLRDALAQIHGDQTRAIREAFEADAIAKAENALDD